jgi:hypothetical protein
MLMTLRIRLAEHSAYRFVRGVGLDPQGYIRIDPGENRFVHERELEGFKGLLGVVVLTELTALTAEEVY